MHDRGATLRTDIDRLVTLAVIPERAQHVATRDKREAANQMMADWEAFKTAWSK
jgi:hypothetical protein